MGGMLFASEKINQHKTQVLYALKGLEAFSLTFSLLFSFLYFPPGIYKTNEITTSCSKESTVQTNAIKGNGDVVGEGQRRKNSRTTCTAEAMMLLAEVHEWCLEIFFKKNLA